MSEFISVGKEGIASLHFPGEEVLRSEGERSQRRESIDRAISLGNLEHYKVKIYFVDDSGRKQ